MAGRTQTPVCWSDRKAINPHLFTSAPDMPTVSVQQPVRLVAPCIMHYKYFSILAARRYYWAAIKWNRPGFFLPENPTKIAIFTPLRIRTAKVPFRFIYLFIFPRSEAVKSNMNCLCFTELSFIFFFFSLRRQLCADGFIILHTERYRSVEGETQRLPAARHIVCHCVKRSRKLDTAERMTVHVHFIPGGGEGGWFRVESCTIGQVRLHRTW